MGLSGIILKDKSKFDINKLIHDIKSASKSAGILCTELWNNKYDDGSCRSLVFNIRDKKIDDDQFVLYALNNMDTMIDGFFSFIDKNKNYQQAINLENFISKKMLLLFFYEYLKLNPDDIFYNELEWHYTLDDLEKIVKNEIYDPMWCYTPPH